MKKLSHLINFSSKALLFFVCSWSLTLQAQDFCFTTEAQNAWFAKHPELKAEFEKQRATQRLLVDQKKLQATEGSESGQKPVASSIYTIPLVFHILHKGGPENISDAQVIDAVNILNRDFNRLNPDTSNVVGPFKNLIGDAQIEFQLATRDSNGVCTNGIIRHLDSHTDWSGDVSEYIYSWPSTKYLNIYVVKSISFNAAGYTYLPGSGIPSNMDNIVVLSSYVGSIGTSNAFLSRVLTHEVGHWLNLEHTWGWNAVGTTCGDDGINDTPITKGFTSCSLGNAMICNQGIVENVQNYMDYAYCENMFTIGQTSWMQNTFTVPFYKRNFLSDPLNLTATGVTNPGVNCLTKVDILVPGVSICAGGTLAVKAFTWNATPTSFSWIVTNGAIVTSSTSTAASIVFPNTGNVSVTIIVANPTGSSSKSFNINVLPSTANISSNDLESFETPTMPLPSTWSIINPTSPNEKWTISHVDGMGGTKCMYVPGEALPAGSIEILESASYDFKNNPGASFSFKYAYARYDSQHNDKFKVQATKNCGNTWSDVWVPGMYTLAQGSGETTSTLFHPTALEWKTYIITNHPNFNSFKNEANVKFRFYFQQDELSSPGNRFYLDDINFTAPVGVNDLSRSVQLNVWPVPARESVNVEFSLEQKTKVRYQLISITGETLLDSGTKLIESGSQLITLNENGELISGIYFLNLELNGTTVSRKIIIQ